MLVQCLFHILISQKSLCQLSSRGRNTLLYSKIKRWKRKPVCNGRTSSHTEPTYVCQQSHDGNCLWPRPLWPPKIRKLLVDSYFRYMISHLICFGSNVKRDTLKSKMILDLVVFSLKRKGMIRHLNPNGPQGWLDQNGDPRKTISVQDTEAKAVDPTPLKKAWW